MQRHALIQARAVEVPCGGVRLDADLARPEHPVGVVVFAHGSRSGRKSPRNRAVADLAEPSLSDVIAPTLLIVGGGDKDVIELNRRAAIRMPAGPRIEVVPGATHLFGEPGALDQVARLARDRFAEHLPAGREPR